MRTTAKAVRPARLRDHDLPATQGMLFAVRDELKSDFRAVSHRIDQVDSKIDQVDSKIDQVAARLGDQMEKVNSNVNRIGLLVEQQDARNRIVLEGLSHVIQRQDRLEDRTAALENQILAFIRSAPRTTPK